MGFKKYNYNIAVFEKSDKLYMNCFTGRLAVIVNENCIGGVERCQTRSC